MSKLFNPEWLKPGAVVEVSIDNLAAHNAEVRRLMKENTILRDDTKHWRDIHDTVVKDSDKAYALLRWVETEMRYAGWSTRLNDQHGRTDVYEAIVEFLK